MSAQCIRTHTVRKFDPRVANLHVHAFTPTLYKSRSPEGKKKLEMMGFMYLGIRSYRDYKQGIYLELFALAFQRISAESFSIHLAIAQNIFKFKFFFGIIKRPNITRHFYGFSSHKLENGKLLRHK